MSSNDDLKNNKIDLVLPYLKAAIGYIPYVGPLVAELVGNLIPNQREDRLIKYAQKFEERLSKIPIEKINALFENENFIDLIEEGFVQASRAISDERREYIANIVTNGIQDEVLKLEESKYLLKIIQEISDIEIIWLNYYYLQNLRDFDNLKVFFEKHKNILAPIKTTFDSNKDTFTKASIQVSYHEHLIRLNLLGNSGSGATLNLPSPPDILSINFDLVPTRFGRLILMQMGLTYDKK